MFPWLMIKNWPSIIPAITTANGNGDDYVLDVMAMTEANMMLWHGSEDDSYSDSSSGSYSQSGSEDDSYSDSSSVVIHNQDRKTIMTDSSSGSYSQSGTDDLAL